MKPLEIKAELVRRGIRQTDIARSLKPPVTQPAIDRVIRSVSISKRIRKAIAKRINKPVAEVWPEAA